MKHCIVVLSVVVFFGLWGCSGNGSKTNKQFVFGTFKSLLERNGGKIDSIDETGLLYVSCKGKEWEVSLDDIIKEYEKDKDESRIFTLVQILIKPVEIPHNWEEAKHNVHMTLHPNNFNYDGFLHRPVTANVSKIYVYCNTNYYTWIEESYLQSWKITEQELELQAGKNADTLWQQTTLVFDTIEDRVLGMIETDEVSLKPALLFAPCMKEQARKNFGFPFYAVIPVRDFCYIFSEKDFNFVETKLGAIVISEYNNSGYPITTEILKFSEQGVEAVGSFPVN